MIINFCLGWGCLDGWDQVVQALVLLGLAENSAPSRGPGTYTRLTADGDPEGHCVCGYPRHVVKCPQQPL